MATENSKKKPAIIPKGEEAKFTVNIVREDFDMENDHFEIALHYGMQGKSITITSEQMVTASTGGMAFAFDTSDMIGMVIAKCTYSLQDQDTEDGERTKTDLQYLCFVAPTPLPMICRVPAGYEDPMTHEVHYELADQSDLADNYEYLCDNRGRRLVTDDDEFILVIKKQ